MDPFATQGQQGMGGGYGVGGGYGAMPQQQQTNMMGGGPPGAPGQQQYGNAGGVNLGMEDASNLLGARIRPTGEAEFLKVALMLSGQSV